MMFWWWSVKSRIMPVAGRKCSMDRDDVELLKENGWEVECESPFEVRHVDGSFATGLAARIVLERMRWEDEKDGREGRAT